MSIRVTSYLYSIVSTAADGSIVTTSRGGIKSPPLASRQRNINARLHTYTHTSRDYFSSTLGILLSRLQPVSPESRSMIPG